MGRASAAKFAQVGDAFLTSAQALSDVAGGDEHYGNAIALLAIHAAIAWSDALSIAYAEQRSTDGDHLQAVKVLRGALGAKLPDTQETRLRRIIASKDEVSYQGAYYPLKDGRALLERAQLFATWGRKLYGDRPAFPR
jgi:hypothetical protein